MKTTIEYLTLTDELGRCRFFLTWKDGERTRSQVFFAKPEAYGHARNDKDTAE